MQLNNYRKRLLDLCKPFNLCIANGRLGNDKFLGNKTCKGSSVIDHAILSPLLFTCVHDFEILPFDPMVSDAHSGIYLCLSCTNMATGQIDLDYYTVITKASWKPENSEMFWQHLNANDISNFIGRVDAVSSVNISKKMWRLWFLNARHFYTMQPTLLV